MNCEICTTKFTRLKDLIRHGTSEKHRKTHFFCIPCAMAFYNVTDVIHHTASKGHSITALASGVYFGVRDKSPEYNFSPIFPSHNCCLLCSSRDGTASNAHLKTNTHKYMAWLLRTIIESKKVLCADSYASKNTRAFISKIINVKQKRFFAHSLVRGSLPFACDLCNVHFNKLECYERHIRDQSHIRIEKFLIKFSHMVKEVDIIDASFYTDTSKTFSNSLRPLFYCEVCYMWIDTPFNYIQHRKSNKHKSGDRKIKRFDKRRICDVYLRDTDSTRLTHYCPNIKYEKYKQLLVREEYKKSEDYFPKTLDVNSDYDGKDDSIYLHDSGSDSIRVTHHYPKLKSERYKRPSVSVRRKKSEESIPEAVDVDSDCIGEKPYKMLKISPSFLNYSVNGKHPTNHQNMKVVLQSSQSPIYRAHENISIVSPPLDFEVTETESSFSQHEFEIGNTSNSALFPLEVVKDGNCLPQHGFEADGTYPNLPLSDSKISVTKSNFPQHELEIIEASQNSPLVFEVTETIINKQHIFEAVGTSPNSPPLDSEIAATKSNLPQPELIIVDTSRNSPLIVEMAETLINKQQNRLELGETSQTSLLDPEITGAKKGLPSSGFEVCETSRISSPSDIEVIEVMSNFKRCTMKTDEISGYSSPRPKFENGEIIVDSLLEFEDRNDVVNEGQKHYCELCDFLSYNSEHYEKHLISEHHTIMRRLINKKGKGMHVNKQGLETSTSAHPLQYNCELCNVFSLNSQEYEHHLHSAMHRKNQWSLYILKQRPL